MTTEPDSTPTPGTDSTPPAPPLEGAPTGPRRLTRSRDDRMVAGVAGGLADYLDVDPSLVRVALVLLTIFTSGTLLIVYLGAWLVIPESGEVARPRAEAAAAPAGEAPPPRRRKRDGVTGALIWGLLFIAAGAFLLARQADLVLPPVEGVLAGALVVVGVLLLISSRHGMHGGLVTLAVLLSVALAMTSRAGFDFDTGFSERNTTVTRLEDLDGSYSHAFGQLNLDLRGAAFPEGTTEITVSVAFGSAQVRVPKDVPVRVEGDTLFGSTQLRGGAQIDGFGVDTARSEAGYATASKRLLIHVTTLFGSTEVQ